MTPRAPHPPQKACECNKNRPPRPDILPFTDKNVAGKLNVTVGFFLPTRVLREKLYVTVGDGKRPPASPRSHETYRTGDNLLARDRRLSRRPCHPPTTQTNLDSYRRLNLEHHNPGTPTTPSRDARKRASLSTSMNEQPSIPFLPKSGMK